MKIEKDGYVFIVSASIENTIVVLIIDKELDKIADVATLELKVYNELSNTVDFDVKSLFNRASDIFEKTRASIDIYLEINKARQKK